MKHTPLTLSQLRPFLRAVPALKAPPAIARQIGSQLRAAIPPGPGIRSITIYWCDIVGDEIARHTRPEKLSGRTAARTLTLFCRGAASTMIESQKATIMERVNAFAGRPVVQKVALKHWAAPPAPRAVTLPTMPDPQARRRAEAAVERVANPELKAALRLMGERLYQRAKDDPARPAILSSMKED